MSPIHLHRPGLLRSSDQGARPAEGRPARPPTGPVGPVAVNPGRLNPRASSPLRVGLSAPGTETLKPGSVRFTVDGKAYAFDAPPGQRAFVSRGDRGFRMVYPSKVGPSALAFLNLPALEKGTYEDDPNAWAVFATGSESYISRPTCGPFVIRVERSTADALWGTLEGTFCAGSSGTATIRARFAANKPGARD